MENTERLFRSNFESIYLSNFPGMVRFACEYTVSEDDAKNIVQDAFTEIWDKRLTLDPDRKHLLALLFTSIKNRCIDFLRHQTVVREAENVIQEEFRRDRKMRFDSLKIFDEELLASEENIEDLIRKAIDALPEQCRAIFIKNKLEGKKQKDIAAEMQLSVNTIETQMSIAYRKLKQSLKNHIPLLLFLTMI
ncbi:MAG: RNA polymerase sigma-70 factor [Tannerella sp.]|jgi:RNA polymerase sigma-70 factor (ECF subfamily)|nr:RNA polymerase sigma-70 factor [Tannerella sp.]